MGERGRQRICRVAVVTAVVVVLAVSSAAGATAPSAQKPRIDENGVLKIGARIAETAERPLLDPLKGTSRITSVFYWYVYDTLLVRQINGKYRPALALSADVVDPSTIKVKLRPGVKFQDGTNLDAEAVKFTILRNAKSNNTALLRAQIFLVSSVDVTSPTELTIHLSKPQAGAFYDLLAGVETSPVSPTAVNGGKDLNREPVGAGPFKLVSLSDSLVRFEKWPGYWDAENVHLAGIELVNTASSEAIINALTVGAIDTKTLLSITDFNQLSNANLNTRTKPFTGSVPAFDFVVLNCVKNPDLLGDARVRRALAYATDRDAINRVVYQGDVELMSQFAPKGSVYYNPDLEGLYEYNLKKAKKLLAQAGRTGFTMAFNLPPVANIASRTAEMLQQQWAQAGVTLQLTTTTNLQNDFFNTGKIAGLVVPNQGPVDQFGLYFSTLSVGGTCAPEDSRFKGLLDELYAAEPRSPEAVKAWQAMDRYVAENAHYIPLFRTPTTLAWNKRLGKMTWRQDSTGGLVPDFKGTYVAAGRS